MHFVTGGAYNGKRKWVKEAFPHAVWYSAYNDALFIESLDGMNGDIVVLEGIECWTRNEKKSRTDWKGILTKWNAWEKEYPERKVIIIGTDIGKGIVPIDATLRSWRDLTGWVYQDLVEICDRVDIIWYGIPQKMKG